MISKIIHFYQALYIALNENQHLQRICSVHMHYTQNKTYPYVTMHLKSAKRSSYSIESYDVCVEITVFIRDKNYDILAKISSLIWNIMHKWTYETIDCRMQSCKTGDIKLVRSDDMLTTKAEIEYNFFVVGKL